MWFANAQNNTLENAGESYIGSIATQARANDYSGAVVMIEGEGNNAETQGLRDVDLECRKIARKKF